MKTPSLRIVINSCDSFYNIAGRQLLESLKKVGVPTSLIHVVVGESNEKVSEPDQIINDVWHHFRPWCNIDNNGFLWITQEPHPQWEQVPEWIFYMHDTTLVVPGFWENCLRIIQPENVPNHITCIRLRTPVSMGMGFYRTDWLLTETVIQALAKEINLDPRKKMELKADAGKTEDFVFHLAERNSSTNRCASLENPYTVVQQNVKMYGSDTPRIIELYRAPGVLKIKANYMGLQTKWTTNL